MAVNPDLRTEEDNAQRYWWMDEAQITEHLKLRDELRKILAESSPCHRWWCFKRLPHTHEDQDPDLANKQALERRLSLHRDWEPAASIQDDRTDR